MRKRNIIKQAVIDRTNYEEILLIQDGIERLTEKQKKIVNMIASGYSWDEIAQSLHVCKGSISIALCNLKKILDLKN